MSIAIQSSIGAFVGLVATTQYGQKRSIRYLANSLIAAVATASLASINQEFADVALGSASCAVLTATLTQRDKKLQYMIVGSIIGGAFNAALVYYARANTIA